MNYPNQSYQGAENFDKSTYQSKILPILRGIIAAYQRMLGKDYSKIERLEDKITGRLLEDFLDEDDFRREMKLTDFDFSSESAVYDEAYKQKGYVDIRVRVNNRIDGFNTTKADYIIECKLLDGGKDLNRKYLTNGICRFVEELYTDRFIHKVSAMLGFVISKMDILANTNKINQIAINEIIPIGAIQPITSHTIHDGFDYSFLSKHTSTKGRDIELYHLMLDFSSKINSENVPKK